MPTESLHPGPGRPGDPLADVVFAIAFDAFLKLLNAELADRGLQPTVAIAGPGIFRPPGASPGTVQVHEQTYMDDTALPLEAEEAGDIFGMLVNAADALLRVARALGLQVNFTAGKTEAVVHLVGPSAAEERRRLWADVTQGQVPELDLGDGMRLRLVQTLERAPAPPSRVSLVVACSGVMSSCIACFDGLKVFEAPIPRQNSKSGNVCSGHPVRSWIWRFVVGLVLLC